MSGQEHDASINTIEHSNNDDHTKRNIGIYLRVRPTSDSSQALSVAEDMLGVHICVPRSMYQGYGSMLAFQAPHSEVANRMFKLGWHSVTAASLVSLPVQVHQQPEGALQLHV